MLIGPAPLRKEGSRFIGGVTDLGTLCRETLQGCACPVKLTFGYLKWLKPANRAPCPPDAVAIAGSVLLALAYTAA